MIAYGPSRSPQLLSVRKLNLEEAVAFRHQQRAADQIVGDLISLNNQYEKAMNHDSFWSVKQELRSRLNKVHQGIKELTPPRKIQQYFESGNLSVKRSPQTDTLNIRELKIVERVESIYLFLERIARNSAKSFSDSDKANLRRAQSQIQRVRLWLYDVTGTTPPDAKTSRIANLGLDDQR